MPFSHRSKNRIALAAICLASLMFGLEISSVPVILPGLEGILQADFKQMQWVMNAYTIACTTIMMATGTLADRFGRRRVFIISILAFGIASLLCGMAQDISILIASRALQGLAGGAMLIAQVAILSHQFREGRERSNAFGAWGIVFGIGLGFGPIIGGLIVAASSWHWVFLVHVLIAVMTLSLVFSGVEESQDPQAREVDSLGITSLSLSVFGLAYYITQGPDLGLGSTAALCILAATIASFVVFLYAEKNHVHPMFDFSVFRIRNFSGALLGSIGMNFSFWPFMIYLPIYFQSGLGYDPVTAGLALLAYTLPTLVFPPVGERLALRYHPGVVIPGGLFTIGLGFMLMKYGSSAEHASWLTLLPGCLVAGMGLGITNTPVTNTTTGSVDSHRAGMASGIDMSARMISLAVNIALMGLILAQAVYRQLKQTLAQTLDDTQLHRLSESIASGNTASNPLYADTLASGAIQEALAHAFGSLMLYGGMSVWLLALLSLVVFAPSSRHHLATN